MSRLKPRPTKPNYEMASWCYPKNFSMGYKEQAANACLYPGPATGRLRRVFPRRNNPDFGEELVLTIVPVVFREHFPELLWDLVRLAGGIRMVVAGLVVADAETGAAAIAELERFDRI